MSNSTGITNTQQAILVFASALIAALGGWAAAGFPTSRLAIGAVVAAILIGAGLAVKELLGGSSTTAATSATPAAPVPKAAVTPTAVFRLKRRLMFLQLRS